MANWSVSIKIKVHLIQNRPTLIDLRFFVSFDCIFRTSFDRCHSMRKWQISNNISRHRHWLITIYVLCRLMHSFDDSLFYNCTGIDWRWKGKKLARAIRLNAHSGSNYSFWEFETIDSPKAAHSFSIQKKDLIKRKK